MVSLLNKKIWIYQIDTERTTTMRDKVFKIICDKLGYNFKNRELLEQAFTRRSYTEENPNSPHNEILELYGDSIVNQFVTKHIAQKTSKLSSTHTSQLTEGEFTELRKKFIGTKYLSKRIKTNNWHQHLQVSVGDEKQEVIQQESVQEALLEAIIGAIAVDSNWDMIILEKAVNNLLDLDNEIKLLLAQKNVIKPPLPQKDVIKSNENSNMSTTKTVAPIVCKPYNEKIASTIFNEIKADKKNNIQAEYKVSKEGTEWCCVAIVHVNGTKFKSEKCKASKKRAAHDKAIYNIMTQMKHQKIISTKSTK